jgi:hypothetical protein
MAERPRGFLGINWGASPEEAKRVMQARPGVKFPEDTDDYKFELTGGMFAGKPVLKWTLEFPERKFATATVVIDSKGEAESLYKEFRKELVAKYGSATTNQKVKPTRREPNNPTASVTLWKFPPNIRDKSNITVACELTAAPDPAQMQLSIRYTNETLTAAAAANLDPNPKTESTGVKKEDL